MGREDSEASPQISTEYSDPFDLKQPGGDDTDTKSDVKAWLSEDDYSVPYEVQTDNVAESKPSEFEAEELPSMNLEAGSTTEDAGHAEPPPASADAGESYAVIMSGMAENPPADTPENRSAVVEPDKVQALELEEKPDRNLDLDFAFDGGGPGTFFTGACSPNPPTAGLEQVLADPSAGMYDAPWDLFATQKHLEEKLFQASLTPPPSGPDCAAPNLDPSKGSKSSAKQIESVAMHIYDEPWDKKAENLHQSFFMVNAGSDYQVHTGLPHPNQKYRSALSDPSCTHWRERSFHGKSGKGVDDHHRARSGIKTGMGSCYPSRSSFCALHSDQTLKSRQHHHDHRHSTFRHRCGAVDESLPLEKQSWYHGAIGRVAAETLLRFRQEGSYLVRASESDRKDYSLSVKSNSGDFLHMKIVRQHSGFILGQFSQPFTSIPQIILYYTINKLPIRGTEHMTLSFPVCSELHL